MVCAQQSKGHYFGIAADFASFVAFGFSLATATAGFTTFHRKQVAFKQKTKIQTVHLRMQTVVQKICRHFQIVRSASYSMENCFRFAFMCVAVCACACLRVLCCSWNSGLFKAFKEYQNVKNFVKTLIL